MHRDFIKLLLCLASCLLAVSACDGHPRPLLIPSTPLATQAVASPLPTITPTAVATATTLATARITYQGVSLRYTNGLVRRLSTDRMAAVEGATGFPADGPPLYYFGVPDLLVFNLEPTDDRLAPSRLVVQRLRDDEGNYYTGYPEVEIGRFDELATDIENSGATTVDPTRRLLRFQNGRGLRTVGYLPVVSGLVPLADEQIFYLFEGLTDDGRYYIWLQFNLHTTLLPDSASQFSAAQQTAFAAGSADYQAYLQAEMARVQALPATAFTPDLNLLDELVQSLDVPATASTTSSLPPNEPNCTNVATYIADITIPRDLDVPANATFNKTWRVQNMGTCTWSAAYQLRTQTGILLPVQDPVVPFTLPGDIVDISVTYYAPSDPGTYQETWQLNPPFSYEQPAAEPFGPNLPVVVTVSNPSP